MASSWLQNARNVRVPRWAIGVAIATPTAAIVQGGVMLHQYRRDHGHAPHPISPSQGLVVVSSTNSMPWNEQSPATTKPLRLLVIGDSLAVGVGVSQSGTPILPQSIARALSLAIHGRAVHWTCIGTPGASSSQIVHDLVAYQDTPSLLERRHVEWQVATRKAKEWWEHRKKILQEEKKKQQENKNRVRLWWSRVRRDVEEIKDVIHDIPEEAKLQTRLTRRKTLLDPDVVTQYDIAVVLTGINDLKDAFLPFMMQGKNASSQHSDGKSSSLKDALVGIIHALQSKMHLDLSKEKGEEPTAAISPTHSDEQKQQEEEQQRQQVPRDPLIVFPGMPSSPLPLTHYPPLSWFLVPLIKMMDNNKRLLAQRFPGLVLYVDPPSPSDFSDIESGRGELYASRRAERVLLQLTNVTQRAQERVRELMDQHYKSDSAAEDTDNATDGFDGPPVYGQGCRDHHQLESKKAPGSTLLAEDQIHPNDSGYDFWGRHIAAAIVREWKQQAQDADKKKR